MQLGRLALGLAVLPIAGCGVHFGESAVVGTGPVKQDARALSGFTKIQISNAIQATIDVGGQDSVKIEAQESLLPFVSTRIEGDRLIVETTRSMSSTTPIKAVIRVAKLETLGVSGASEAVVHDVSGEGLDLGLSGASRARLTGSMGVVKAELSGASQLQLSGSGKEVGMEASGASQADLKEFVVDDVKAEVSGASRVETGALKRLRVNASGASRVTYRGNPEVTKNVSGASSVQSG